MSLSIFKIEERTPSMSGMISVVKTIIRQFKSTAIKPYDILILEYGIDRPGEMEFLCSIAQPHISILTKLDAVHSLQFGNADQIAHEELKLQHNTLLHCYINNGEEKGMALAPKLRTKYTIYDTIGQQADITSSDYTITQNDYPSLSSPILTHSLKFSPPL